MPKPTFFNLKDSKRDLLMQAARVEFAFHDYADAKLDRIASAAGVPKGSLYQYFEGKEEFYLFTIEEAMDQAWELFQEHVARRKPADCFELMAEGMLHMAILRERHPELAALYARVVFAQDTHARGRLYQKYLDRSGQFYARVIPWGREEGLIDPGLPDGLVRFHLSAVGSHFQHLMLTGERPEWVPQGPRKLRTFARQLAETLRRALAPQSDESPHQGGAR